jgi:vacuolar-type H+-ATPase catalytic subunit A/Vma1
MMKFEELREVNTPAEMRAELFRIRRENALANQVMMLADRDGLSAEDRYTLLAYHALKQSIHYQNSALELLAVTPTRFLIKTPE